MDDNQRYRLNLYEMAPRGHVVLSMIQQHPLDPTKQMLMFGVELTEDMEVGAGSTVAFLPREVAKPEEYDGRTMDAGTTDD